MAHYGLVCPPMHGHMHPMFSLGRELLRRGHQVTAVCLPDAEAKARAARLEFAPIGADEYPPGRIQENAERLGKMSGPRGLHFTVSLLRNEAKVHLRDVPGELKRLKIDGLLVDQVSPAAGSGAEAAGIPFVTVCNALMLDQEPGVPPMPTHWSYRPVWWARMRNRIGFQLLQLITHGVWRDVNSFRAAHGLPKHRTPQDWSSKLATVAQVPAEFDFPRRHLPETFHYAGPFQDPEAREPMPFPFEQLDGRPLIYASMGTLQNRVAEIFRCIATACSGIQAQVVLALGGADPASLGRLPGSPIVVKYAPQLQLLQRASLTITHAGLNTVMESLACGVPMVAIPITNDQPGAAARIEWIGAGERIHPDRLTVDRLRAAVQRVLTTPSYRMQAARLQQAIASAGGVRRAADVVEAATQTRGPVLRRTG